jgi:hypothetical protein
LGSDGNTLLVAKAVHLPSPYPLDVHIHLQHAHAQVPLQARGNRTHQGVGDIEDAHPVLDYHEKLQTDPSVLYPKVYAALEVLSIEEFGDAIPKPST